MKHLIKIESTPHGVLGVRHAGLDQQYCEAGEVVTLEWQPDAKWGLQEAHYTDGDGNVTAIDLTRVKVNGVAEVVFTMPAANITIGGTFKRFVIEDWTGKDAAFSIVGSFDVAKLPMLDGFNDAGKVAFVKDTRKYATWDGYGWTYMDGTPVTPRYLTFTANEDGSSVGFVVFNDGYEIPEDYKKPSLRYSTDGGNTWQDYDLQISDDVLNATTIQLDEGESVMFKGLNDNLSYYLEDDGDWFTVQTYIEGSVAASGDITSLLNGVGGDVAMPAYCCSKMFRSCAGLTTPPNLPSSLLEEGCYDEMFFYCTSLTAVTVLPATTLAINCYNSMFYGCTSLISAPVLPATTLANGCYAYMLGGCTGLTSAPVLPATTLANGCYANMFKNCTGLTEAPALPATTLVDSCYEHMFEGCTGLTSAPELPATTLSTSCYGAMFAVCTGLTQAPVLPATTLANGCYNGMFYGCTSLTSAPALPAMTLTRNCYNSMFHGCTGLTQAPSLPATTLAEYCYAEMFRGCTGLTQAPALSTIMLAGNCYNQMFQDCTSLNTAPTLPATTLGNNCYSDMFSGCTNITSHDVATLNNSANVFQNNSSCTSFTIHADTPPTIGSNTISGLKADCIIYVPTASVDAYKAKQYWSARAAYIQAIP